MRAKIHKKAEQHSLAKFIALLSIGIALSLGIIIIHLTLARATIVITASKTPLSANEEITLAVAESPVQTEMSKNPSPLDDLRNEVLGRIGDTVSPSFNKPPLTATVKTLPLTIENTITPEGEGQKIPSKASGMVTIVNELPFDQQLVASTRLLTPDNVLFRLRDRVVVLAHGKIAVEVEADKKGEEGNINPTTFIIPGLSAERQKKVYAISEKPFTGGAQIITTLSEADFKRAEQEAIDLLKEKALETLNKEGAAVSPKQLALSDVKTTTNDTVGEEKGKLTLTLSANAHAVIIDSKALLEETKLTLSNKATPPFRILSYNEESFSYEITALNKSEHTVTIMTYLEGFKSLGSKTEALDDESNEIVDKRALIGLTAEEIQAELLQNDAIQKVQVTFSPFWVTRAPRIADKIAVIIEN